jgi:hypothetical protein
MTRTVRIDRDRLRASLMELEEIGAYVDELAAHQGVEVAWERMAKSAVVPFHRGIQELGAGGAVADAVALACDERDPDGPRRRPDAPTRIGGDIGLNDGDLH